MLDLMQQELDFSRGEALTLASLTVDLIRRPAFTYRSPSVLVNRDVGNLKILTPLEVRVGEIDGFASANRTSRTV